MLKILGSGVGQSEVEILALPHMAYNGFAQVFELRGAQFPYLWNGTVLDPTPHGGCEDYRDQERKAQGKHVGGSPS